MSTRNVKYRKLVHHDAVVGSGVGEYTKVLLHFDESTLKDECGNTWYAAYSEIQGPPTLSTNAKSGKALYLNGQNLTTSNTFSIGSQDWTLDFWIYKTNTGSAQICDSSSSSGLSVIINSSSIQISCAQVAVAVTFSYSLPLNSWHHMAIVRSGNTFYLFVDGVKQSTQINSSSFGNSFTHLFCQSVWSQADPRLYGYVDEFRFSLGIARWTEDFTLPTVPYNSPEVTNIKFYDKPALKPNIALNGPSGTHTYAGLVPSKLKKLVQKTRVLPTGGIDQYTKVMLHFDESAAKDECGNTWTADSGLILGSSNGKFGKYLSTTNETVKSLTCTQSQSFDISKAPLCIDFWTRPYSASNPYRTAFQMATNVSTTVTFNIRMGTQLNVFYWDSSGRGGSYAGVEETFFTASTGTWYHGALVITSTSIKAYVNGQLKLTKNYSSSVTTLTLKYILPYYNDLDEFRISYGIARWTENFTPPTAR